MKKALLFFALSSTLFSFSQEAPIRFGVQAGVNYSRFWGYDMPDGFEQFYDEGPGVGYLAGFSAEYDLKSKWSLRVELNYERKSTKADQLIEIFDGVNGGSQTYEFTSKSHHDYLVLPLLFKYRFAEKNSFFVNGGPFIGFLLQSKMTNDLDPEVGGGVDAKTTDNYKTMDFGFSIGLGKAFAIGNQTMHVEIRENLGLFNISKIPVFGDGSIRTNSLSFMVGVTF